MSDKANRDMEALLYSLEAHARRLDGQAERARGRPGFEAVVLMKAATALRQITSSYSAGGEPEREAATALRIDGGDAPPVEAARTAVIAEARAVVEYAVDWTHVCTGALAAAVGRLDAAECDAAISSKDK